MEVHPELLDYITKARAAGMADEEIRSELVRVGWRVEDIDSAVLPPPTLRSDFSPALESRQPIGGRKPDQPVAVIPREVRLASEPPKKTPVQAKPARKSRWLFYTICFLLIVAGGAVYYFLPQIVAKMEGISPIILPVDNNAELEQQASPVDETASWQTYRNEEYGFEVKIPSDYSVHHKESFPGSFEAYPSKYSSYEDKYFVTNSRLFILAYGVDEDRYFKITQGSLKYDADSENWFYLSDDKSCPREAALWEEVSVEDVEGFFKGSEESTILSRGKVFYYAFEASEFNPCPGEPIGDDGGNLLVYYIFTNNYQKMFKVGLKYSIYPSSSTTDAFTLEEREVMKKAQEEDFNKILHLMADNFLPI